MIDKFLFRKRGHFYCMFVDFAKAFDTVNLEYLICSLEKSGMHGRVLKLIQEVYSPVKATLRTKQGLTDFLNANWGATGLYVKSYTFHYAHKRIGNNAEEVRVQRNLCG